MHRSLSVAAAFVFLLVTLGAAHPQRVIRYDLEPGQKYTFEQTTTTALEMVIEAGGQQMNATENSKQVATGWVEVVKVVDGRTTVARIHFGADDGTESTSSFSPQPQRMPFELAGRTVRVTADADGRVTIAADPEDPKPLPPLMPDTKETVRGLAIPDPGFPPKDPVGVGDSWTTKLGHPEDEIHPPYTFTVLELTDGEPRAAQLKATAAFEAEQEGATFSVNLAGEVTVDMKTGLPVASTMSGPMKVNGSSDMGGGMMATITGTGTISQVMRMRFVDGDTPRPAQTATTAEPTVKPTEEDDARKGWKLYSSALSKLTFRHPPDWRVEMSPSGLLIVPDDFDQSREMLFGLGAPAGGETNAAAAQVQQNLDALVRAQAPMLRRTGRPTPIQTDGGSGASYSYSGTLPDGRKAVCLMLVRILDDESAVLGIIADEARTGQRSPVLQEIFGTIAARNPSEQPGGAIGDRRLLGMFQGEVLNSNTEGIYMNTQLVYAFGADRRVYFGAQSMFTASKRDYNDDLVWTASGGTDESVRAGTWTAENGLLSIRWDDGEFSTFAYGFEPDGSLVLRNPYTKELINFYPRVR
jgi:hypothetical protein